MARVASRYLPSPLILTPCVPSPLAGTDDAREAGLTVVAWANGFIGMELAGAFRLSGDVDRAFDYGIDHIIDAIAR